MSNNIQVKKTILGSNEHKQKIMETDLLPDVHGNVQALRKMWSLKVNEQQKPSTVSSRPHSKQQQKSSKQTLPTLKTTNEATTDASVQNEPPILPDNEKPTIFEFVEKLPPIDENMSLPMPPPPPTIMFRHQAQSVATLKQCVTKMDNQDKKNVFPKTPKNIGIHLWHIARHVFRSGLIFNRPRRASDTIIPLLIKTHAANRRSRTDSIDSALSDTPFEHFIDYLSHAEENDKDSLRVPKKMKRSTSDTSDCMRRNKLDDSIFQYEMILRHLKNYDQFMLTFPLVPPPSSSSPTISKERGKSFGNDTVNDINDIREKFPPRRSISNRQTQSLSRNVGRTFSEFIMNDIFLSTSSRRSSNEQRCYSISHVSSQTDLSEPTHSIKDPTNSFSEKVHSIEPDRSNSIPNEETKAVLHELDTMLEDNDEQTPITPNTEINVIVLNSPVLSIATKPGEEPLMQRLFDGKKTAYGPDDLDMKPIRLPEEMMLTYEIAKNKCFFDSEELIYTAKMIKISRKGYSQHLRMLCITTERLYNLTKKDPYPKEGLLFDSIIGLTCTPYRDGFICVHTKDVYEDRGDWLIVVDHPCECITQLFMAMGRDNNDDHFLKFESTFTHCRRFYGEGSSSDCKIEARLSDTFRIKKADFDEMIIYTP